MLENSSVSGWSLIGSQLLGSFGEWDEIEPDLQVPNNSFYLMYVNGIFACCYHLVNVMSFALTKSDPIKQFFYCMLDLVQNIFKRLEFETSPPWLF